MTASIIRAVVAAVCVWVSAQPTPAAEVIYPTGFDISATYSLNKGRLHPSDTLVVTRTLVNKTDFSLYGLYLSDNFPPSFQLARFSAKRNLSTVNAQFNRVTDTPIDGQVAYYWVFDDPDSASSYNLVMRPGDSLTLVATFLCPVVGDYQLPLHTTVFFSDEAGGFFGTSSLQTVSVEISTDVDDDPNQPRTYLTSQAYPNPFNHTVTIEYAGARLGNEPLEVSIYNVLGQMVHKSTILPESDAGTIRWDAPPSAGSGVFYYRLTSASQTSGGKLVLLK